MKDYVKWERPTASRASRWTGTVAIILVVVLLAGSALAAPGDVKLKRKAEATSGFPVATFPHWVHRVNYRCDACHTRLFQMKAGTAEISMADLNAGRACGTCHNGERAFPVDFTNCARCHVPEPSQ